MLLPLYFLLFVWFRWFWDLTCDFWAENAKNTWWSRQLQETKSDFSAALRNDKQRDKDTEEQEQTSTMEDEIVPRPPAFKAANRRLLARLKPCP
jgi:hypothetical protein